jgi:hypothetical protein
VRYPPSSIFSIKVIDCLERYLRSAPLLIEIHKEIKGLLSLVGYLVNVTW